MAQILSIQIAQPTAHGFAGASDIHDKPWETAFYKQQVTGPVDVTSTGIVGDGQADRVNHGGVDKAICCYASEHFPVWHAMPGLEEMGPGGFGENLTTEGLIESEICIGDVFTCGTATFQITQPRQPCWKLSRRWRITALSAWVERNGLTGWYLRVLKEGQVAAGDELLLVERPNPDWSIARANDIAHHRKDDRDQFAALAAVPFLSAAWREAFTRLANAPRVA
jgi:MOSC domain-containing protein YiiM